MTASAPVPADADVDIADPMLATEALPNPACPGGLRDRKKQATRRALRYAALELVAERGFAHVTVEDIATAADVATRTFFNYFPSKESAVIGADPERIEELRASLLGRPAAESPLEALRWVTVEYAATIDDEFGDLGEGREAWFRRFSIVREDPDLLGAYGGHVTEVERSLVEALAERLGKDPDHDPYPALLTATVFAATRVAALYWSANGGVDSLARLTGAAIDFLAGGLLEEEPFAITGDPVAAR
ncbi:MAG: TetR family transcriptional regulator [Acidimicrobiales bacterium]